MSQVHLGGAPPETVLPGAGAEQSAALAAASGDRRAVSEVASRWPRYLDAWAELAELAEQREVVTAYACARTGYHRGLDALRAAGWTGTGYVRWHETTNRGFLASLDALRRESGMLGETEEEQRCELLCYQLDPDWGRVAKD